MPPNTWYDDNPARTSYWGGGLIADMGPFLAWPLMTPAVLDGTNGGAVFFLALPNPAAPDDPLRAGDGTYATDIFVAYRFQDSSDPSISYENYWSAREPSGVPGTSLTPGMHLYVDIDWDPSSDGPPAFAPEYYVPPGYASFGSAAYRTVPGGWSDLQPGPVVEHAAVEGAHTGSWYGSGTNTDSGHSASYPPTVPDWDSTGGPALSDALADIATTNHPDPGYGALWHSSSNATATADTLGYTLEHGSDINLGESFFVWFVRQDLDPIGPDDPGSGLTWADVGQNPDPGTGGGYANLLSEPGGIVGEWLDCTNFQRKATMAGIYSGALSSVGPFTSTMQCWFKAPADEDYLDQAATPPRPVPGSGWELVSEGEQTYTSIGSPTDHDMHVDTSWESGSDSGDMTTLGSVVVQALGDVLPFGSLPMGTPTVQAMWGTGFAFDGTGEAWLVPPDPPQPAILVPEAENVRIDVDPSGEYSTVLFADHISAWTSSSPQPYHYTASGAYFGPPYLAHNPPWRYWKPNRIVAVSDLAWHTAGGHWSSPQLMQILTPGVGWVPIVDGPA